MISHVSTEPDDPLGHATREAAATYTDTTAPFRVRTRAEVEALFDTCQLIEPGIRQLAHKGRPVTVLAGIGKVS